MALESTSILGELCVKKLSIPKCVVMTYVACSIAVHNCLLTCWFHCLFFFLSLSPVCGLTVCFLVIVDPYLLLRVRSVCMSLASSARCVSLNSP